MKKLSRLAAFALVVAAVAPHPAAAQAVSGLRADLIAQFDDAASKLVQLAEAVPQSQYNWRPAPGVRSVSEVLLHMVNANYYLPSLAGVSFPQGVMAPGDTGTTDRMQIVERFKRSADHVRAAIRGMSDADLDKAATMFGRASTNRNVLLTTVSHAHEHLGQMIAYARANNITPPWSVASR